MYMQMIQSLTCNLPLVYANIIASWFKFFIQNQFCMKKLHYYGVSGASNTKNPEIIMAATAQGQFIVRLNQALKSGFVYNKETKSWTVPTGCVIGVQHIAKGDFLYEGDGTATQRSSRLDDKGNPVYLAGDKPKAETDLSFTRVVTTLEAVRAQRELDKMNAELA